MRKPFMIICLFMCLFLFSGCTLFHISLVPEERPLREKLIEGAGDRKILLLDVTGIISEEKERARLRSTAGMVDEVREALKKAEEDKKIAGVVLRINSPGGTVTASDILRHELLAYRQKTGVPVVACMMGVAASGGYYIATAADEITAHPTTITGSIGVIAMKFNVQGLFEKIGVESETIKSGDKKDILSPFRPATPEEIRLLQAIIDQLQTRFIDVIVAGRKGTMTRDEIVKAADGRVYTARQALDLRLIDRIAYLDETIDGLKKRLNLEKAQIITYHRPGAYKGTIYSEAGGNTTIVNLFPDELESMVPKGYTFMYLWNP